MLTSPSIYGPTQSFLHSQDTLTQRPAPFPHPCAPLKLASRAQQRPIAA